MLRARSQSQRPHAVGFCMLPKSDLGPMGTDARGLECTVAAVQLIKGTTEN